MNKCEWCNSECEDNKRFCSHKCRSKYAASKVKNRACNLKNYIKNRTKKDVWKCIWCDETFEVRKELYEHVKNTHTKYDENGNRIPWNKGLTKKSSQIILNTSNKIKQLYETGKLTAPWLGKKHSNYTKLLISKKMKKAHAEGRAHNIGQSRWNNEPSYPETWFMTVIDNEFTNKNYVREKPFGRFSLDFAWENLKKCIEIDGEQHQRFEKQKIRDIAKNKLLKENGWEILRIPWISMFHNPKEYIQKAKEFIDGK